MIAEAKYPDHARFISGGARPFDLYSFIKDYLELLRRALHEFIKVDFPFAHSSPILKCQKVLFSSETPVSSLHPEQPYLKSIITGGR